MKRLFLTLSITLLFLSSFSQSNTEKVFSKIEELGLHNLQTFTEISRIEVELTSRYSSMKYTGVITGWVFNETIDSIYLLSSVGQEIPICKDNILNIWKFLASENCRKYLEPYSIRNRNDEILTRRYEGCEITPYIFIANWFHLNNTDKGDSLINVLQEQFNSQLDTMLVQYLGNLYYNEMLVAFTEHRDRNSALKFGRHLCQPSFSTFQYYAQIKLLTEQLEHRSDDFVSFTLPDSLTWLSIQKKMTRYDQIEYLLDRLRLLNCEQPGQPAWIDYRDIQTSISFKQIMRDTTWSDYAEALDKYSVINPYNELLDMEIQIKELQIFLPYLKSKEFIASYEYWRDFSSNRVLHPVTGVVLNILYNITNKKFVSWDFFYISEEQKDLEIKKIKEWIASNSNVSYDNRIKEILVSTNDWGEFKNAMYKAQEIDLENLFFLINNRIGDFKDLDYPSPDGTMMQTMMNIGSRDNINVMKEYLHSEDIWVRLWSSIFLIKNNPESFDSYFKTLKVVVDSCYGSHNCLRAIPTLIEINDFRLLKLAEGILERNQQDDPFFLIMYEDLFRILIVAGSQKTYEFFLSGLDDYRIKQNEWSYDENDNTTQELICEDFIYVLNNWRLDDFEYDGSRTVHEIKSYSKELSIWLTLQFEHIRKGEEHYIEANLNELNLPHSFIDSPGIQ